MEKKTVLAQMELPEGRNVMAHFQMRVVEGDSIVAKSNFHTVNFMPEDYDFDDYLNKINQDITTRNGSDEPSFPWPPIPAEEWQRAVDVCNTVHTPEVKAAYQIWKSKAQSSSI